MKIYNYVSTFLAKASSQWQKAWNNALCCNQADINLGKTQHLGSKIVYLGIIYAYLQVSITRVRIYMKVHPS